MVYLDWRFFPVSGSIDPGIAYTGVYHAGLVALSVVVATLAAFVALSISGRIEAANSRAARCAWASAGASAMGGGIWGMHFIGMLAFSLPCGVSYDPVGTVLSMIPGILASGVALNVISRRTDPRFLQLLLGSVLMGAGIGLMHYSGMAAMEPQALLRYDPSLVGLSIVVAIALSFLSLSIRFRFYRLCASRILATIVAAPVMGFAVAGMHYTAMQASIFFPLPDAPFASMPASPTYLAMLITVFIVLVMAITLVATFAGRQVELAHTLAREITERQRTAEELITARQQAETANRAKSQFLATMSHEIRTPMNGVIGTANLLASTPLNERQNQLVQNLVRSGQALLGIINDILDLSKIEAGRFDLATVDLDPRELVAEVTDLFCERCTSKGLEFVYFVAEGVPRRLVGDPTRLRQVLINLVGNAVKFTERGEILIELSVAASSEEQVTLLTSVRDTGIGISHDHLESIFDAFHQVDGSMTRSRGGTGLGLAIIKELVTLMGGEIGVESEIGWGSRFWFTVPLGRSPINRNDDLRSIQRPLRVLVADGNTVSSQIMQRYFDSWGIDAVARATAAEAEAAWHAAGTAQHPFDVAIIDVKGLGCGGMRLARTIRSGEGGSSAEVILLIGLDGSITDASLESVGAFALLTKPPRPSLLFDCLASIASGARENGVTSFYVRTCDKRPRLTFDGHVLVVEDNPVNQDVATGILRNLGCTVVTVPNGLAAVQCCTQEPFDLILMDCEMPVMDGFDATKRIREIERIAGGLRHSDQARSRIPIVALTAHALAELRDRCIEAGMDDFLVKPFNEQQMADMLGRWLTPREIAKTPDDAAAPPVAAAPTSSMAIDLAAIEKIRAIGGADASGLFAGIVEKFATTSRLLIVTIFESCARGDPQALWRAAHSLKSSAAALGASVVAKRCADIEARARKDGVLPLEADLAALDSELAIATKSLSELVHGNTPAA
jgi:two-component system, sensor histidine kinase and response regulator